MSHSPPNVVWIIPNPDTDTYRVLADISLDLAPYMPGGGPRVMGESVPLMIKIPAGFETDGASIPRPFWLTTGTPFRPRFFKSALIHDYLYRHQILERSLVDQIFREMLLADGVCKYTAIKMYYALRLAGWIAWNRHRRRLAKSAE